MKAITLFFSLCFSFYSSQKFYKIYDFYLTAEDSILIRENNSMYISNDKEGQTINLYNSNKKKIGFYKGMEKANRLNRIIDSLQNNISCKNISFINPSFSSKIVLEDMYIFCEKDNSYIDLDGNTVNSINHIFFKKFGSLKEYKKIQSCNPVINNIVQNDGNTAYFIDSVQVKSSESYFFDTNKIISTKIIKDPIKINGVQFSSSVYLTSDKSIEFVNLKSLNENKLSNDIYTVNDKLIVCPNETNIDKNSILNIESKKLYEYSNTCIVNLISIRTKRPLNEKNKNIIIK